MASLTDTTATPIQVKFRLLLGISLSMAIGMGFALAPSDAHACSVPPGGSPTPTPKPGTGCGGGGPASTSSAAPDSGVGNPINILNGNKYQEETDLDALPGVLGLEFKRYYNSQSSHAGLLGGNWRMSYETVLYDFGGEIQILQADGRRLMFQRGVGQNAELCTSPEPQDGQVRIEAPKDGRGAPTYHWRWADGRTLSFSGGSAGGFPLQAITAATGERLTLNYAPSGELTSIRDPQGRKLLFIYASAAESAAQRRSRPLKAIDTPLGRLAYTQDSFGRLTEVAQAKDARSAPFVTRLYHYEDRYNAGYKPGMTGISIKGVDPLTGQPVEQRLSTYAYNAAGLAILTSKGRPREMKDGKPVADTGIEQVEVRYITKPLPQEGKVDRKSGEAILLPERLGRAILTNSLGQQSQVTSAVIGGHFRLVEMRGPGCSTCGPSDMRYAYDNAGLVHKATKLDQQGRPVRSEIFELDEHGRTSRVGIQAYANGKAEPTRWTERYEYADVTDKDGSVAVAFQPSLIARPSVIAGKEHTVAMSYNAFGQVTKVSESGWSPVDDSGKSSTAGEPIVRSTAYSYNTIDGKSVLVEIDGPLRNGPLGSPVDSDITRVSWDATGVRVTGILYPMGSNTSAEFDDRSGALAKVTGPSGVTDTYGYGPQLELLTLTQSRGNQVIGATSYRYDLRGHLLETSNIAGGKAMPETLRAFDVADRLLWQVDRLGVLKRATYDTEDHLVRSQVLTGSVQQEERYIYDAFGRLERVEDNTGATRRLWRDENGRITAVIDPLGRATEFVSHPGERALEVTQAANTGKPLAVRYGFDLAQGVDEVSAIASDGGRGRRHVTTRLLNDDFGREVAVFSADSGAVYRRYDEADQPIRVTDANGSVTDVAYDAAGRMVKRTVRPAATAGAGAEPQTTRYVYDGTRLIEIQNPQQTEHYTYDARARLVGKSVRLAVTGGHESISEERYRYDADGRLLARSLPDGSELQFERNAQGQIVALSRQTSVWAPFGRGRTTLVSNLEADLIGLRSATYGNGVIGQWQRSREGVLARVAYISPLRTQGALRTAFENLMAQAHAEAARTATTAQGDPPALPSLPGAFGMKSAPQALWDGRLLYDLAGNVRVNGQFADTAVAQPARTRYTYDGLNQLAQAIRVEASADDVHAVAAREPTVPSGTAWRYHADSLGNRLLAQEQEPADEMGRTTRVNYAEPASDRLGEGAMDVAGRPLTGGTRQYAWDADGRLAEVSELGKPTARYRYDARGLRVSKQIGAVTTQYLYDERRQRVAELDAQGRVQREYVWLGNQLLAVIDLDAPRATSAAPNDLAGRLTQFATTTWREWTGHADTLTYVHSNHLGAPVAMTDADAKPVWGMEYSPFGLPLAGKASPLMKVSATAQSASANVLGVSLDLRMPGQWEDHETGLYYNDHRYYDPRVGRYLNPDPSGLSGGLNAYAYVNNNPIGFSDPLGLVLFAFDGTSNDESNSDTYSNVVKFKNNYQDGQVYYITGPGTNDPTTGIHNPILLGGNPLDVALSITGKARVAAMIKNLVTYSDTAADDTSFNIDIVGFSRGAAEARDFASQIASHYSNGYYHYTNTKGVVSCQKLSLNFMGLWDTVLSTHVGNYQLAIPAAFKYVAQATALNEYRGGLVIAFPSESILGVATPVDTTRVERGFLGSHSDIGGSFPDGELSKVALVWMANQAKLAGVTLDAFDSTIAANPVIHDKSSNLTAGGPTAKSEDRDVRYADGTVVKQRKTTDQGMTYADTQEFITYKANPSKSDNVSGTVDAKAYLQWLNDHGYGLENLTVN